MAFRDDDKERVRTATSIVDLIGAVTTVKRSGRTHMAVCPFHQEKTPSMSIDVGRGLYYCHGCHASGDIFTFVMETQGIGFGEAMEVLADRAGITLTRDAEADRRRGRRRELVEAVRQAVEFYHRTLVSSPEAGHARAYLRGRGYDAEVVADFKLGYAPGGDGGLVRELRSQAVSDQVMLDAGLARKGRGGLYDYFRDRVLFPTNDLRGDPVGFGGRILGEGQPKYLNTPETPLYKKSQLLYGLDRARREMSKLGFAVVVEGYTDVIGLHRSGLPVAVATNGTALGDEHFDLLRRFADQVVLAFDPDEAGGRAALRGEGHEGELGAGGEVTISGLDVRVAQMELGLDPADMIQQGRAEELIESLRPEASVPLREFLIRKRLSDVASASPEVVDRSIASVAPYFDGLGEFAVDRYARMVAGELGTGVDVIKAAIGRHLRSGRFNRPAPGSKVTPEPSGVRTGLPAPATRPADERLERELLRAILEDGGRAAGIELEADWFTRPRTRAAFERLQPRLEGLEPGEPVPLGGETDEVEQLLMGLATEPAPVGHLTALADRLYASHLEGRISELRDQLGRMEPDSEPYSWAFQELLRLQQERREKGS